MTTGQRIKAARKKAGLTQEDLGKKLGVSGSFIAQYETNNRNPKLDTLQRIAAALEVPIQELMDVEDLKHAVIYGEVIGGEMEGYGLRRASEALKVDFGGACTDIAHFHHRARIAAALDKLNEEGQEKAAERVEELTEIPRYQTPQPPQQVSESTPATQEGRDTTPSPDAPETPPDALKLTPAPPEGQSTTPAETPENLHTTLVKNTSALAAEVDLMIRSGARLPQRSPDKEPNGTVPTEMICPLCGKYLQGNPQTMKAFCPSCRRSFPLSSQKISSPRPSSRYGNSRNGTNS